MQFRFQQFSHSRITVPALTAAALACLSLSTLVMAEEESAERSAELAGVHYMSQEVEPAHHLVLATDYLLARDVTAPPGGGTQYHLHDHDVVMITLATGDVPQEVPGQKNAAHRTISAGSIYYRGYASKHFVHKITNVGDTTFRIIEIALTKERMGLTLDNLGVAWTGVIDNDRVRVSKTTIPPGAELAPASFKGPRLFVATTDGSYSVSGLKMDIKRGTLLPDSSVRSEDIRNTGTTPMELVVLELK